MKRYFITLYETAWYKMAVDAPDEATARRTALELFGEDRANGKEFDTECDLIEVEEVRS